MPVNNRDENGEESQVIEVNPCAEDQRMTLESKLRTKDGTERKGLYFDSVKMCDILNKARDFRKVRCSTELGYAIVEYEDKNIHIWKQGKIIIRRAKDREDAVKTLQMISKMLSEAVIRKTC